MNEDKKAFGLPENFNGTFYFTNTSDEDFTAKWGGIAYTFPARKTSPMIILNATPVETQSIRKKFAREFAENEILKSDSVKKINDENRMESTKGFRSARAYFEKDLEPMIQACLEPLPIVTPQEVKMAPIEKPVTDASFHKGKRKSVALSRENTSDDDLKAAFTADNAGKMVVE